MKQNIKKWLLIFFSFMLIANIACRIKDTYMIPRVKVENPIRTKLEHSFQTEGYFTSSSRNYIQPQAGWKIGKVFVDTGMQVQEEDVLWQYDMAFLEKLLSEKQDELKKQRVSIEQTKLTYVSESGVSQDVLALQSFEKAAAQLTYEQIWLQEAVTEYEKKIAEINKNYDKKEALAKQDYHINCSEEIEETQKALLDTQLASQLHELKEARKQEKESAYDEIVAHNKSLFQAIVNVQNEKQNYDNAVINQQATQEQKRKSNRIVELTLAVLEIEEKQLLEEIKNIEECIQQEGYVYAKEKGNVSAMELVEGHFASGEEKVEMMGMSDQFVFSINEEMVALIEEGDECFIQVPGMPRSKEGIITMIQPGCAEHQGDWQIACMETGDEPWEECRWKQKGVVSVVKKTEDYQCCIPIEALVCQGNGYCCRVIEKKKNILGMEEVIQEVSVTVVDKDDTYACVVGEINEESDVVTDYNKTITDEARVRVVNDF